MRKKLTIIMIGLFTLAGTAGAQVCDLVVVDTVPAPGSMVRPVILGTTAYVASRTGGIVSVDISQPDQLSVLGFETTEGQAEDMVLEYFSWWWPTAAAGSLPFRSTVTAP